MYYEDYEEQTVSKFQVTIENLIEKEVVNRLSERQKRIEEDSEYHRQEMWNAKKKLASVETKLRNIEKETEKQIKEATKLVQREYWFDCAIGDYVYIIKRTYKIDKCTRCNGNSKVKVEVDGIQVDADCPICGTYDKRKALRKTEYSIERGKIERLSIEIVENRKWIRLWVNDEKYELEYRDVFRTKEEAEAKLKELENKKS